MGSLLPKLALSSWTALALLCTACGSTPIQPAQDDDDGGPKSAPPAAGGGGAPSDDGQGNDDLGSDPGPATTASSGGAPGGGAGGGTGSSNDCCGDNATPGCIDATVEACVCAIDNYCCDTAWDAACVGVADANCGTACGDPGAGGGPNTDPSSGSGPSGGGSNPPAGCEQCIIQQCGLECILDCTCHQGLELMVFECLANTCAQVCWGWTPPSGP